MSVEYNSESQLCMVLQERQTSSESEVVGRKVAKSQLVPRNTVSEGSATKPRTLKWTRKLLQKES